MHTPPSPALALSLVAAALAAPVRADFITGRVVDADGIGVPGVDIDVKNLGSGGTPPIQNDGTDANGFFTTTLPAGLYRITFTPPPPPASTHLVAELDDVVVVGTTALGDVPLPPGVALSGRALTALGLPVAGVNIDAIELSSGDNLALVADVTNVFGEFAVAVPAVPLELRLDASNVLGQTLVSRALAVAPGADLDVGDVELPPGHRLTGLLENQVGTGVVGVDLDVVDPATGEKLYTPKDKSGTGGAFSIVVPEGWSSLVICPQVAAKLVARRVRVFLSADVDLGTVSLQSGAFLSGTVRSHLGDPVPGADVDVALPSGAPVELCADNANAAGFYRVVVPHGTLSVEVEPPGYALPLGAEDLVVPVLSDTLQDGVLPACPFGSVFGGAVPGSGGFAAHLATAGGAPRGGNKAFSVEVSDGLGGAPALLLVAAGPGGGRSLLLSPAFPGASLALAGDAPLAGWLPLVLSGAPGGAGQGAAHVPAPVDPSLVGTTVFLRLVSLDPGAVGGLALSDGLEIAFCD